MQLGTSCTTTLTHALTSSQYTSQQQQRMTQTRWNHHLENLTNRNESTIELDPLGSLKMLGMNIDLNLVVNTQRMQQKAKKTKLDFQIQNQRKSHQQTRQMSQKYQRSLGSQALRRKMYPMTLRVRSYRTRTTYLTLMTQRKSNHMSRETPAHLPLKLKIHLSLQRRWYRRESCPQ